MKQGRKSSSCKWTKNVQHRREVQVRPSTRISAVANVRCCLEIQIDESIKRTFAVPSFMRQEHRVQKVAVKEVRAATRTWWGLFDL